MRCGAATTRKETIRVVVNRLAVMRERGCMCGGMVTSFTLLPSQFNAMDFLSIGE
jgi:hypothetical protein